MSFFPKVNEVYGSYFQEGQFPARVCYAVLALPKGSLVEIDAIALRGESKQEWSLCELWMKITKNKNVKWKLIVLLFIEDEILCLF